MHSKATISNIMHSDSNLHIPRAAYAPPTSHHVKQIRINLINTEQFILEPPFIPHSDVPTTICAHIDTGADLTCTNLIEILHDYCPYSKSFPCRIKLVGALDSNNGTYPLGEGYIHVPAAIKQGYVRIQCVYSPQLSSTLISEDDIIRSNPNLRLCDYTTIIYKYYDAGSISIVCTNRKHKNK